MLNADDEAARAILEHWLSKDERSEIINKDRYQQLAPSFVPSFVHFGCGGGMERNQGQGGVVFFFQKTRFSTPGDFRPEKVIDSFKSLRRLEVHSFFFFFLTPMQHHHQKTRFPLHFFVSRGALRENTTFTWSLYEANFFFFPPVFFSVCFTII